MAQNMQAPPNDGRRLRGLRTQAMLHDESVDLSRDIVALKTALRQHLSPQPKSRRSE